MTCRPDPLTREQQIEVGRVVLHMRRQGYRWKALQRQFNMGRMQLWRCMRSHIERVQAEMIHNT